MMEVSIAIIGLIILIVASKFLPYIIMYKVSSYKNESGVNLFKYLTDSGCFGEALIFFELEKLPFYSKIMTNLYIPTEDGTTEIDVLYITSSGLYVIESKNYSGWIFGDERSRNWTAVLYKTKNRFLNPIWQNKKHIKYLGNVLGDVKLKSVIVFSNRCEFKKVNPGENIVIKRKILRKYLKSLSKEELLTSQEIDDFYSKLKRYTNKSDVEKKFHIEQIRKVE